MGVRLAKGNNFSKSIDEIFLFDLAVAIGEIGELRLTDDLFDFASDESHAALCECLELESPFREGLSGALQVD